MDHVLLIEDDTALGDSTAMLLHQGLSNVNVWRAKSAAEAVEVLARQDIQVVLLDLGLPDRTKPRWCHV